ncbi:antibiotic biosynthesis monooxygenase family protein [Lederbergia lenta]|uniref:YhgC n=1 Tax=Lederbergia lenta TaxID=1467 RepID=A0A2X4ZKL9_LEDLE|nr:antibiotic biosynthesis monooxygenase family protein [Lederbergia lenta]MEC2323927.1 antibiotic biosynthesis monooxygenase [Lederbergia lenta]SQI61004.1 YhgC [Lederbergia lenta]
MYTYITSGTYEFLKKLENQYPEEKITLMQNINTALLWHETTEATIFQSPRKYEVINSIGDIAAHGFVVCHNIPVSDEGRPVFEYRFTSHHKYAQNESGFLATRLLRPLSSDTYIIMTMWKDKAAFEAWEETAGFKKEQYNLNSVKSTENINLFSGAAYISTFIVDEEELEHEDKVT